MECIFSHFEKSDNNILIRDEEVRHLKALRLNVGDKVRVSNGVGLLADTSIIDISKKSYQLNILSIEENANESDTRVGLAIGILDNKDRMEFALEKGIELGITDFYPLITKYSQRNKINIERLNKKAIASIKQCHRAKLPAIHQAITCVELLEQEKDFEQIIVADVDGSSEKFIQKVSTLYLVGPEGGFSTEEMKLFDEKELKKFNLSIRRLRAETAAIAGLSRIFSKL